MFFIIAFGVIFAFGVTFTFALSYFWAQFDKHLCPTSDRFDNKRWRATRFVISLYNRIISTGDTLSYRRLNQQSGNNHEPSCVYNIHIDI